MIPLCPDIQIASIGVRDEIGPDRIPQRPRHVSCKIQIRYHHVPMVKLKERGVCWAGIRDVEPHNMQKKLAAVGPTDVVSDGESGKSFRRLLLPEDWRSHAKQAGRN